MARYLAFIPIAVFFVTARSDAQTRQTDPPSKAPYDTAAVNNAGAAQSLAPSDEGPAALRAQILLDRAHFSVGQIDGRIGLNTMRALLGFRAARALPRGIGVDDPVWKALAGDTQPPLISYTIAAGDLKGSFVRVPASMTSKARLKYLGYASPLDELAERFHISPALLRKLNPHCGSGRAC